MQPCNSSERRRRRVGAAEGKEEGVETENGAGNPTGNTPIPQNSGVGVSTRRTTYVVVSQRYLVVLSPPVKRCFLALICI